MAARYVVGPYGSDYFENLTYDISAGVTVALLLIPQVRMPTNATLDF